MERGRRCSEWTDCRRTPARETGTATFFLKKNKMDILKFFFKRKKKTFLSWKLVKATSLPITRASCTRVYNNPEDEGREKGGIIYVNRWYLYRFRPRLCFSHLPTTALSTADLFVLFKRRGPLWGWINARDVFNVARLIFVILRKLVKIYECLM